jgi:hypothetical protein
LLALLVVTAVLAACDLGTVTIPRTKPTIVVHAVLNPLGTDQVVLVERTLTGAVNIPDTTFDSSDPILSAGGVPVIDAIVEIVDSAGRVTRGIEDRTITSNKKGSGVYRVPLRGQSIILGSRYQLRVRTTEGEEVTAFTRVPLPASRFTGGLTRTFNRDREALFVQWSKATARSYFLRIESPFGPFFLFTDSTAFRISGDLRNLFAGELQRVFMPGFRQEMYIAAVDSNFFDYYRTNNDPFTGAGIISRVNGGLGMFGSMVNMNTGTVTVVADQTEPIEGRFRLVPSSTDPSVPTLLTLYIESPAARPDLPMALSGRYNLGGSTTRGDGLLGRMLGSEFDMVLISNQLAGDTVDVFSGELDGDTLRGTYRRKGTAAIFARIR